MFATEEELRQSFIANAKSELWSTTSDVLNVRTAQESTCSEGRADWVWAGFNCDWFDGAPDHWAVVLQQQCASLIMSWLKPQAPRSDDYLHERIGVTRQTLKRSIDALLECELIEKLDDSGYVLGSGFRIPQIEICSFEFKLDNWRRAFQQAKRYRAFSHRVYVVMPEDRLHRIGEAETFFRRFNVGLIGHSADGSSTRRLLSRKIAPHAPHNFIQALGFLLNN